MIELDAIKAEFNTALNEFKAFTATITADGYEATAEEKARFDELEAGLKAKKDAIEAIHARSESEADRNERLNRLKVMDEQAAKIADYNFRRPNEESDYRGADQDRDFGRALAAWGRINCSNSDCYATMDEVEAGKRLGVNVSSNKFQVSNPDVIRASIRNLGAMYAKFKADGLTAATMTTGDQFYAADTDGLDSRVPERAGYLNRAPEFLNTLESNMIAYGGILQAPITIMVTDHYADVIQTYGDDTTHSGRQIGEGQTIGTTLTPAFGTITWKEYKFTSDDVPITNEQLERSRYGLPPYVAEILGQRLGRSQGSKFTTGTGAVTPQGIVTATTAGGTYVETATSLVIAYADLVDLESVLDPLFWRMAPEVGFMAHPKVLPLLRKISTGTGEAKLMLGEEKGERSMLFGRRIHWNNDMTAPAAGAWTGGDKAMLFGDFSRFVVRRAGGGLPRLIRDDTTNRRTEGTIFTALMNFDSRLRDYGANPLAELRIKS